MKIKSKSDVYTPLFLAEKALFLDIKLKFCIFPDLYP